LLAYALAYMNK